MRPPSPSQRRSPKTILSLSTILALFSQVSTATASCNEAPIGMPQGFSIRDTTDSTVKFVINTDTRQKIANLVCFHNRWFMSMDPTTGRFPDFGSAVGRASSSVSASSRYRSSPRRSPGRRQLSPRKLANYVSIYRKSRQKKFFNSKFFLTAHQLFFFFPVPQKRLPQLQHQPLTSAVHHQLC